ncbi:MULTISPECIES: HNH endonuclease [unclassified Sphingobium]|uniref:HNH endonuclease n=1 Tax=unclassified Sphingobium TaxID=2611147 RepID=UPI0035A589AF
MGNQFNYIAEILSKREPPSLENAIADLFSGFSSDDLRKKAAWERTSPLSRGVIFHPTDARVDELGNIICLSHYGRHDSIYGWEIDHVTPRSLGGGNGYENLRALSCRANRSLGGMLGAFLKK